MPPGKISIVSFGESAFRFEDRVGLAISSTFGLSSEILSCEPRPDFALNEVREQYDALELLTHLEKRFDDPDRMVLALTHVDLFISVFTFVFGHARLSGRAAVVSSFRLREEYYDRLSDPHVLFSRIEKSAIHEVGHMLGLIHCVDRNCVMHASNSVADTDVKSPLLCPGCRASLSL